MIALVRAELLKLRRSLVLLILITPPAMVALLGVMVIVTGNAVEDWSTHIMAGAAIWAYFLMPMSVIGVMALLAQIEHAPRTWTYVLATPWPKWQILAVKAALGLGLMAILSVGVALAGLLAAWIGGVISPENALDGSPDLALAANLYGRMWLAGIMLMAIQWTISMRFYAFAIPVSVGIGGTFVAVAATSARSGLYFPWLMPVNILASDPERAQIALLLGSLGGLAILAIGIAWLTRRDWA